jgi:hypothetical protein
VRGDEVDHGPSDVASEDGEQISAGQKPESPPMLRRLTGRLTEWIALCVIIGLVVLGSWNWASDVGPPAELSAEDLQTLEMLRALRDVDVDVELMMTSDSPNRWILDRGFDAPEEDATWMTDTEATLEFRLTSTAARTLHLFVYPFVSETVPSRTLTVETTVGSVDAELNGGGQLVSVAIDGELDEQVVTLRCDAVDSPADLGLGSDIRSLCLKLISVQLSS